MQVARWRPFPSRERETDATNAEQLRNAVLLEWFDKDPGGPVERKQALGAEEGMHTVYLLGVVMAAVGCASAPNAKHGSPSPWPGGSEPQLRTVTGVKYGQQGKISVVSGATLYAVFLELRPGLDSLDVRPATNVPVEISIERGSDLYTSMETVDALQRSTVTMQATNCTTMKMGTDDSGPQFCPISRSYEPESGRPWRFRNRVFLLVSDQPFTAPLPRSLKWLARGTMPPVAPGAKWTAFEL